jgi:hypothetical protein
MRRSIAWIAVTLLPVVAACSPDLPEFADWTIPVPEGTPVIEYTAEQIEAQNSGMIALVEDLRIGADEGDPDALLYMLRDIAVDDRGWIYVSDIGHSQVLVFDSTGRFIRSIGRGGEGPGEFTANEAVEVVGEHIVVNDAGARRLSVWTTEGEHIEDHSVEIPIAYMFAVSEDALVVRYANWRNELFSEEAVFSRLDLTGREVQRYAELADVRAPSVSRSPTNPYDRAVLPIGIPLPWATASAAGRVYLTAGDEYQVLALTGLGDPLWSLRVEWTRQPVKPSEIEAAIEDSLARLDTAELARIDWPELQPALSRTRFPGESGHALQVDGHGHLYVFPYVEAPWLNDDRMRPVHVYSEDGNILFAGLMPRCFWLAAQDDYVYTMESDPGTGAQVVVRYRLVEPF